MKVLLVVYDNGDYVCEFPMGTGHIARAVLSEKHEVIIYNQDIYHFSDEHLKNYIDEIKPDIVGISSCGGYYQYRRVKEISQTIKKCKHKFTYILGGALASPEPEYFLRKFGIDIVVIGEGEQTIIDILNKPLKEVLGIAYIDNGTFIKTGKRELLKDIDLMPAYDLFPMEHYALLREPRIKKTQRCMPILSSRGCTFACNFCYRMDKGYRIRSNESIVDEIIYLKRKYHINYIFFLDELLMGSEQRTILLSEALMDLDITWACNGRLNYATDEVIKTMQRSGCVFINYGIESLDDEMLKVMRKHLTVEQITKGIETTLKYGISPGFNIIFGNIGETKEILMKGVDFLIKYDDQGQLRTIRPVTPYPGSELYYYAIKKGLLKDCEDFYENKHLNSDLLAVNFTDMTDSEFYNCLLGANKILCDNYFYKTKESYHKTIDNLYINKDNNFRGFRW